MRVRLLLGRLLSLWIVLRIFGNKGLAGLVRVEFARLLAEGFGQLILGRAGLDAEEIVEGDVGAICFGNFVTDAEDFVVCSALSASSSQLHTSWSWGNACGEGAYVAASMHLKTGCNWRVRTLFGPGSGEGCKEAQDQCEQRVRSHVWGLIREVPKSLAGLRASGREAAGLCRQMSSSAASPLE